MFGDGKNLGFATSPVISADGQVQPPPLVLLKPAAVQTWNSHHHQFAIPLKEQVYAISSGL